MKLSAAGLELLKKAEGFRSKPYKDIAGCATIGYGHRIGPNEFFPPEITEEKAEAILQWDIHEAEDAVTRLVKVPLSQGQFDALVDFTFNLGATRLRDSTLLEVLNDGNYDAAGRQLLRWDHSGTHEVMALEARREAECRLWIGSPTQQTTAA
jgi:lysozyme